MPECPKADLRDPVYLAYWQDRCGRREASCFVLGTNDGTVVPHHVRARRRFGEKWNIVPICFVVHSDIHDHGYAWVHKKYGVSREQFMAKARMLYEDWVNA
jgi:hypothetical protein